MAEPARTPSSVSAIGWGIVTLVAQVALLDAAVETFRSGSPLRWWVAAAVVAFVALSAWLWRPGGAGAKRWGSQGAAWWSTTGLLLLLAMTAWLPGGQTDGVRMLRQPTGTLLTAAVAAAVLLAAYILIRAFALVPVSARMIGRGVVIALALYAVLALGLAVHAHTPFAALFQGGAMWQRLPRWLQGPFLGAFVLLPLAVVFQVVRFVDHARRTVPVRLLVHQTTALVMAVVLALSGVMVPVSPAAPERIETSAAPGAIDEAVAAMSKSRSDFGDLLVRASAGKGAQAPPDRARLKALYAGLAEVSRSLPRESFDPEAVARRVGSDPVKLFEWVRDNTSLVPYRGALRGPVGVLMDRQGNSLDRALLLARLLAVARVNARLARATIAPGQAQSLVLAGRSARPADTSDSEAAAMLAKLSPILGADAATLRKQADAFGESASAFAAALTTQVDARTSMLLAAVGPKRDPAPPSTDQPLLDHWWVQAQRNGAWLDLDPSDAAAAPGATLASATQTMRPDDLPASLYHQVEVRVIAEQRVNGRLQEKVVLARALRPAVLAGRSVVLAHVPLSLEPASDMVRLNAGLAQRLATAAQREVIWLPVLSDGGDIVAQKVVSTSGQTEDLPAEVPGSSRPGGVAPPPAGGLAGFLGGGQEPQRKASPLNLADIRKRLASEGDLTAEWIEYSLEVPGVQSRVIRREVFDLLGPAARSAGEIGRSLSDADSLARGLALFSETEVLLLGSRLSPGYVTSRKVQTLLDNRAPLEALLGAPGSLDERRTLETLAKMSPPPGPLFDFASVRSLAVTGLETTYVAEPNVLSVHSGLSGSEASALRGFRAFDIVWNAVAVREGLKSDSFSVRVRQGTFDSLAEEAVLRGRCCGDEPSVVSGALSVGGGLGAGVQVLRTGSDLARVPMMPPDARERIAQALRAGSLVVVPTTPGTRPGWWRIDQATGTTLYVGPQGWGQGMTEYSVDLIDIAIAHIPTWAAFIVKLVAVTVCVGASLVGAAAGGPTHSTAANIGVATLGVAICLLAFGMGFTAMAVGHGSGATALSVGSVIIEGIGAALEWVYHQMEANREGVTEKKE